MRLMTIFTLAMLLASPGCSGFQERLIFPGQIGQGQAYTLLRTLPPTELIPLQISTGDTIKLLFGAALDAQGKPDPQASTRPTVMFFYGNVMALSDCITIRKDLRKLGLNFLGVEYPGYGMSTGHPSEAGCYAAADAAYEYLLTRDDIDHNKIMAVGMSLGTGVAIELATRKPIKGLVLFAPYTSMGDMAWAVMPWYPAGLLLKHHFRNEDKIKRLKIPILIFHGDHDRVIPPWMSKRLAKAAVNAQVQIVFVNSDHSDLLSKGRPQIDAAMREMILGIDQQ